MVLVGECPCKRLVNAMVLWCALAGNLTFGYSNCVDAHFYVVRYCCVFYCIRVRIL